MILIFINPNASFTRLYSLTVTQSVYFKLPGITHAYFTQFMNSIRSRFIVAKQYMDKWYFMDVQDPHFPENNLSGTASLMIEFDVAPETGSSFFELQFTMNYKFKLQDQE